MDDPAYLAGRDSDPDLDDDLDLFQDEPGEDPPEVDATGGSRSPPPDGPEHGG
jgi:hypothetical protein